MLETLTLDAVLSARRRDLPVPLQASRPSSSNWSEARSLFDPYAGRPGPRPARAPFALEFKGPAQPVLPQRIYPLEHAAIGRHELFIVPIGPAQGRHASTK